MQSLMTIFEKSGAIFIEILPYVVFSVLVGEFLKFTSWTKLIYIWITKSQFLSIFISAILGMVSPLCTYGTVPVLLQLFRAGIPIAPLVTFLSASTLMNPQLFIMTWGGLDLEMALMRVGTVFMFALIFGNLLRVLPLEWVVNKNALKQKKDKDIVLNREIKQFKLKVFFKNSLENLEFVGFYLVIGIIAGAIIEVYVPSVWFSYIYSSNNMLSVLIGGLMGIPLYACGGGIIPLVRSLIESGMSRGAALAFFIVGPATRVTPLMALATILKPLFIVVYIILLISFSLLVGFYYQ